VFFFFFFPKEEFQVVAKVAIIYWEMEKNDYKVTIDHPSPKEDLAKSGYKSEILPYTTFNHPSICVWPMETIYTG